MAITSPLRDDESVAAGGSRDVGKALAAERAARLRAEEEALRARSAEEFMRRHIANVAHELGTPTTVIWGIASKLAEDWTAMDPPQLDDSLERLTRQSERLERLLRGLLDVAALQTGRLDVRPETVRVAELIRAAVAASSPPGEVTISIRIEGDPMAFADPFRAEQILVNLLTNAFRYGGSNVTIEASERGAVVLISVADNGLGVPPDQAPDLFKPFERGKGHRKGSGLGLSIAKGIAEAMGGDISHTPNDPNGARFSVNIPVAREPRAHETPTESESPEAQQRSLRILVVDDEPDIIFIYELMLRAAGYEVISAMNGREALEIVSSAAVDLILTDMMMPVMDGIELVAQLRSDPATAVIPIAMVSALPSPPGEVDATMGKPFKAKQLLELVDRLTGSD